MAPRVQWFEFNDSKWVPASLRETMVVALSRAIEFGHLLDGLVDPFAQFLEACGTTEVLDVCSGAGGPASILSHAMHRRGIASKFLLSDLQPHPTSWTALIDEHQGRLDYVPHPVDVTQLPAGLGEGRARLMINALHHFSPEQARSVLRALCANGAPGVFIAEGLDRNLLSLLAMSGAGMVGLYSAPWFAQERWKSLLYTWASPVALWASMWDGTVSCLRAYPEATVREWVSDLPGFTWEFGTYTHSLFGRGTYFSGVAKR